MHDLHAMVVWHTVLGAVSKEAGTHCRDVTVAIDWVLQIAYINFAYSLHLHCILLGRHYQAHQYMIAWGSHHPPSGEPCRTGSDAY